MKTKYLFKILGYIFGLMAFYFIYIQITQSEYNWFQIRQSIKGNWVDLVLAQILYIAVMFTGAILWGWILNLISEKKLNQNIKLLIKIHSKSNIGKYFPGNFMQFVGRGFFGSQLKYLQTDLLLSTILEIIFSIAFAAFVLFILSIIGFNKLQIQFFDYLDIANIFILIGFFVLLIFVLYSFFQTLIYTLYKKFVSTILQVKYIIFITNGFLIAYIFLGFCNYFILHALTGNIDPNTAINIFAAYLVSWIAGFILPGPPGGLGVREYIFISLLTNFYELSILTLSAIVLRLINILGDIIYFIICYIFFRGKYNNKT